MRNLRRDPWAQACVCTDRLFGRWLYIEGRAEVLSLQAMEPLIAREAVPRVAGADVL